MQHVPCSNVINSESRINFIFVWGPVGLSPSNKMKTYTIANFPKPIVTYGTGFIVEHFLALKNHSALLNQAAVLLATFHPLVGTIIFSVLNIINNLKDEVDSLYALIKDLEMKLSRKTFDGKLNALVYHLQVIQDPKVSNTQKVSELSNAISQFHELLPWFGQRDSIFRERYQQGAPLFVALCVIFKTICMLAEDMPGYSTRNLEGLLLQYQQALEWFKRKCIGKRLVSCYVTKRWRLPGAGTNLDEDELYKEYREYYDWEGGPSCFINDYADDLGGSETKWLYGFGEELSYQVFIVDMWDTRAQEELEWEPCTIQCRISQWNKDKTDYANLRRSVLREYRRRLVKVMVEDFDSASVINTWD